MDSILTRKKGGSGGGGGLAADVLVNALTDQISLDFTNSGIYTVATSAALSLTNNTYGDLAFALDTNILYAWNDAGWYKIANINTAPQITGGYESAYLLETNGNPITITLVGSDPEGVPITWSYAVTAGSLTNGGGTTATISQNANAFTVTPTTNTSYGGEFSITWTASDGINLATALSSFTLSFGVANSNYSSFILKIDSTNGNNIFTDSSDNGFTLDTYYDVSKTQANPFSLPEGYWSTYFSGTGSALADASNPIGSNDFTVDCLVKIESFPASTAQLVGTYYSGAGVGYWAVGINSSGNIVVSGNEGTITSTVALDITTWHYVTVTRTSGVWSLWLDGVLSNTSSTSINTSGLPVVTRIGGGGLGYFNGYISNVRIIDGTAVEPTEGLLTVPLPVITNTKLLTCSCNRLLDTSETVTLSTEGTGVASVALSPFAIPLGKAGTNLMYSPYFDGVGDRLEIANTNPNFSDLYPDNGIDFTAEAWVYAKRTTTLIVIGQNGTSALSWAIRSTSGGNWEFCIDGQARDSGIPVILDQWIHVALVWDSTNTSMYGYVNGERVLTYVRATITPNTTMSFVLGCRNNGAFPTWGTISNARILKNTALYTGDSFTVPNAPLEKLTNTKLLITTGSAQSTIWDSSRKNAPTRLVGAATVDSNTTKYGDGSVYIDGATNGYLSIEQTPLLVFGGDFTIDGWVYMTNSTSTARQTIFGQKSGASSVYFDFRWNGSTQYWETSLNISSSVNISNSIPPVFNSWMHFAFERYNGVITVYINGVALDNTISNSNVLGYGDNNFRFGVLQTSSNQYFNKILGGYFEGIRIYNGIALHQGNFTPPAQEDRYQQ